MAKSAVISKKSKKRNQCYLDKETRNVVKGKGGGPWRNGLWGCGVGEI